MNIYYFKGLFNVKHITKKRTKSFKEFIINKLVLHKFLGIELKSCKKNKLIADTCFIILNRGA